MQNKSLSKNVLFNIIYRVLNVLFPIISMTYIARVLLSDGVGRISAVENNVSYFIMFATLGIPTYGLREIAKNRQSRDKINTIFSELFTINSVLSILTYFVFIMLVLYSNLFRKETFLYLVYGFSILLNIINVDWLFQGLEEYVYIATRNIIIKAISIIALFIFVKKKEDIYIYAIFNLVASCGNHIFNILKSKKYVEFSLRNCNIYRHMSSLIYLAMGTVSTQLYAKMDITMLDIMTNNSVVGYYANSQKIINIIITTLVAATAVFMPRLIFLFNKDKEEFNRILNMGFNLMTTISIPSCIGLVIISKPMVITFLGEDFLSANITISILSLMIPLKCVGDLICYQVMMCAYQEKTLMKSYFLTMVVNFINNIWLIPRYQAVGASIASVVSEILAFAFVWHFSKAYCRLDNWKKPMAKTLLCSAVMAATIIPIAHYSILPYIKVLLEVIVGILSFCITGYALKHEIVIKYTKIVLNRISRYLK